MNDAIVRVDGLVPSTQYDSLNPISCASVVVVGGWWRGAKRSDNRYPSVVIIIMIIINGAPWALEREEARKQLPKATPANPISGPLSSCHRRHHFSSEPHRRSNRTRDMDRADTFYPLSVIGVGSPPTAFPSSRFPKDCLFPPQRKVRNGGSFA